MKPAIHADNLSKQYRLGTRASGTYRTLRETITDVLASSLRRPSRRRLVSDFPESDGTVYALKDVSFEVQPGEVVGVIGPNGAGKSTLLKILSRVTEPTSGRVILHGRVGSLLEVGTGFHPELTGRENIYLNGSILGMSRREVARKFEAIVAFSELESYLDTPVKRYSSGMYVRLAFAVASHLDPEILFVDEVLAVGDMAFQKKCLGKMSEVSRQGRTVLLVSHNMAAILNLCKRVAVIDRGKLMYWGIAREGVEHYIDRMLDPTGGESDLSNHRNRAPSATRFLFQRIILRDNGGLPKDKIHCGAPLDIELMIDCDGHAADYHFRIEIEDSFGCKLFTVATYLASTGALPLAGRQKVICHLPALTLSPGRYSINLFGALPHLTLDRIDHATWFEVIPSDFYGNGRLPIPDHGRILVRSQWSVVNP